VRINTVPIEAYRQTGSPASQKTGAETTEKFPLKRNQDASTVILPGSNGVGTQAVQAQKSPSLLAGVLSSDERSLLVQYFGRFGDSQAGPIYRNDPGARETVITGQNLDVTV